jgi:hypothetical protein
MQVCPPLISGSGSTISLPSKVVDLESKYLIKGILTTIFNYGLALQHHIGTWLSTDTNKPATDQWHLLAPNLKNIQWKHYQKAADSDFDEERTACVIKGSDQRGYGETLVVDSQGFDRGAVASVTWNRSDPLVREMTIKVRKDGSTGSPKVSEGTHYKGWLKQFDGLKSLVELKRMNAQTVYFTLLKEAEALRDLYLYDDTFVSTKTLDDSSIFNKTKKCLSFNLTDGSQALLMQVRLNASGDILSIERYDPADKKFKMEICPTEVNMSLDRSATLIMPRTPNSPAVRAEVMPLMTAKC